jgi:arabinofuranosyltransferase
VCVLLLAYCLVLLLTAWVGDDAFITWDTARNFLDGYGLRFNIQERVQAFTNPLMLFAQVIVGFFTREGYFSSLLINVTTSLAAFCLLGFGLAQRQGGGTISRPWWATPALLPLGMLVLSKSFVDYSTSGLENSFEYLLLAVFALLFYRTWRFTPKQLIGISLLGSLALLTRMDSILLLLPALAFIWIFARKAGFWRSFGAGVIGLIPFLAWEAFTLFYYGSLVPNTYYAKVNTGIPAAEMLQQGFAYYLTTFRMDPVGMTGLHLAVALAIWAGVRHRDFRTGALAAGIVLYCIYLFRVGGDFMVGRHFAAPIFLAAITFTRTVRVPRFAIGVLIVFLLFGIVRLNNPLNAGDTASFRYNHSWIRDERLQYDVVGGTGSTALLALAVEGHNGGYWNHHFYWEGLGHSGEAVTTDLGAIGMSRLAMDRSTWLVDPLALSDPLLSRLPARYSTAWHVGHFYREIPAGYVESLTTGENVIEDENLRRYYDKIKLITQGPLWSAERLQAIVALNLGRYNHLIDFDRYRYPETVDVKRTLAWDEVSHEQVAYGTGVGKKTQLQLDEATRITLPEVSHQGVRLGLDQDDVDNVYLLNGTSVVAVASTRADAENRGIRAFTVELPPEHIETGFDSIVIGPVASETEHYLAYAVKLSE